jgi:flagellar motor switch protein FliG
MSINKGYESVSTARNFSALSGVDKSAIILLILGEERTDQIFQSMEEPDIIAATRAMATIGKVPTHLIREACETFSAKLVEGEVMVGSLATVERILKKSMSEDKIASILDELKAPAGKTTWEKLATINAATIAAFLETEGAQKAAVVLTRLPTDYAAKVVEAFTAQFNEEVIERVMDLDSVPRDTLNEIEAVLQSEFMATLGRGTVGSDSTHFLAEIFNRTSSDFTERTLSKISEKRPDEVSTIQSRMFTFNDILNLDGFTTDRIMSSVDSMTVVTALKGAPQKLIDHIVSSAGIRKGNNLREELSNMGSKRRKDIKAAQNEILKVAKKLEADGEIALKVENEDDQLVN